MNSDLYFEGKKYISSSRAAKISGYVNDYIGQLCRDGKLDARMVGRSWYVALDSLISHKNSFASGTRSKGTLKIENETAEAPLGPVVTIAPVTEEPAKVVAEVAPAFVEAPKSVGAILTPKSVSPSKLGFGGLNVVKVAGVFAALFILVSGFRIGMMVNPDVGNWYATEFQKTSSSLQANVFSAFKKVFDSSALAFYNEVQSLIFHHTTSVLVSNMPSGVATNNTSGLAPEPTPQGMVVVPTDANTDRAGVVKKIENSFSDEVNVVPDDNQSGVITPVFKKTKSDDYLYVLVPLK